MKAIPNRVAVLDAGRKRVRYLERESSDAMSEADCDQVIVDNLDLIGETLRSAGVLGETSDLVLLGRQVRRIDLLCAERDASNDELRRLVLIEDKLFRNPEARRQVVAQLLDYAANLNLSDAQDLLESLDATAQEWLEDQMPQLRRLLATSDYLLLIAGDEIRPSAVRLVERMARDRDPLSRTDVAMLSLALFRDGDRALLLPNLVGGVFGAQRELRVHVEVKASDPSQIERLRIGDTAEGDEGDEFSTESAGEFLESNGWAGHAADAARLQAFLETLRTARIAGLRVSTTKAGRPVVYLDDTRVGTLKILSTIRSRRSVWDSLVARDGRKLRADSAGTALATAFRDRLLRVGFRQHENGRVEADVATLEAKSTAVIDTIRELAQALRTE